MLYGTDKNHTLMKKYQAQLYLIPFALLIILLVWLLTGCETTYYRTSTNFYELRQGMSRDEFLQWDKTHWVYNGRETIGGRPVTTKTFNYGGDVWEVWVYNIYDTSTGQAYLTHQEYAAFVNGKLKEWGTGNLPITISQNPNQYTIINR